jgi:cobalamin biosynthesis protein CobT
MDQAQSATKVMATRLSGLLQTQTLTRSHTGRRGRIDGPRLHRLAVRNPRVFQRLAEKKSIDTAVHILMDCSSSMEGCMSLANAACFSVASALRRIRGVNVGVTAFPGFWDHEEPCTVAPILKHGQRMHSRFAARAFGSTPMGEALWWTCQEMMTLKEERKIILLLSDGYPDSVPNTEAALEAARSMGMEIIGIGIGEFGYYILDLVENSRVINEIEELAPAMFGVLQQALTERELK